jgi:hypothetical protein
VVRLIDYFRHKEIFPGLSLDRKRITKASDCKHSTYKRSPGEGGDFAGQELPDSRPNLPSLHG